MTWRWDVGDCPLMNPGFDDRPLAPTVRQNKGANEKSDQFDLGRCAGGVRFSPRPMLAPTYLNAVVQRNDVDRIGGFGSGRMSSLNARGRLCQIQAGAR